MNQLLKSVTLTFQVSNFQVHPKASIFISISISNFSNSIEDCNFIKITQPHHSSLVTFRVMASVHLIASLAAILLFFHPMPATSNFLSPLLSPIMDDMCKKVECGKGKCKASSSMNSSFLYECECDPGWNQTPSNHTDGFLKHLPCIIPNCTLDTTCTAAPPSVQDKAVKTNGSIFDPCYWTDCGGGSCNKTSQFTYKCECAEGYFNLFNVSAFSCFKECSIGMDCANLGISTANGTTTPPPALSDSGKNQAGLNYLGNCHWLIVLVMSFAILL